MKNRWLVNVYKLRKKDSNQLPFSHFVFEQDKKHLDNLFSEKERKDLSKSCKIWLKNCETRFVFHAFLVAFCIFLFLIGACLIIWACAKHYHEEKFGMASLVLWIIDFIIWVVFYYGEDWDNPFMYAWAQYLQVLKQYLINQNDLPESIYLFYYPDQYKASNYAKQYEYFLWLKNNEFPKKVTDLVEDQMDANKAGYNYIFNKDEKLDNKAYYKYWGNMVVIYEWALFLSKYIDYSTNNGEE